MNSFIGVVKDHSTTTGAARLRRSDMRRGSMDRAGKDASDADARLQRDGDRISG